MNDDSWVFATWSKWKENIHLKTELHDKYNLNYIVLIHLILDLMSLYLLSSRSTQTTWLLLAEKELSKVLIWGTRSLIYNLRCTTGSWTAWALSGVGPSSWLVVEPDLCICSGMLLIFLTIYALRYLPLGVLPSWSRSVCNSINRAIVGVCIIFPNSWKLHGTFSPIIEPASSNFYFSQ